MLSCAVLENTPECVRAFAKFARVLIQKLIGSHHESHCVTAYVSPYTWLLKQVSQCCVMQVRGKHDFFLSRNLDAILNITKYPWNGLVFAESSHVYWQQKTK